MGVTRGEVGEKGKRDRRRMIGGGKVGVEGRQGRGVRRGTGGKGCSERGR